MLGGRAAELNVFGTISTGASDDIQKATELVRRMVTEFGMSEKLGSVRYAGQQMQYLGNVVQDNSQVSPQTEEIIDAEVRGLITEQLERAGELLRNIARRWRTSRGGCWPGDGRRPGRGRGARGGGGVRGNRSRSRSLSLR